MKESSISKFIGSGGNRGYNLYLDSLDGSTVGRLFKSGELLHCINDHWQQGSEIGDIVAVVDNHRYGLHRHEIEDPGPLELLALEAE